MPILNLLQNKATLITPNTRLSQYFQSLYREQQIFQGIEVFETPQIFSYDAWLKQLWQIKGRQYYPELALITNQQSHVLWEEIISINNPQIFNVGGVVREIKKAWKLCCTWKIFLDKQIFVSQGNIDTAMFFECALAYQKKLAENNWIDSESLLTLLNKMPKQNTEQQIIITGFDNLPTGIAKLFQQMSDLDVIHYNHQQKAKNIHKSSFLSDEEEFNAFIHWVNHQPLDQIIGCIMPNITEKRKQLDRILKRHWQDQDYTISAGYVFSEYPMISQGLKMLSLDKKAELKEFYFILDSCYFGEKETKKRALAMKAIHEWGNEALPLTVFLKILKENKVKLAHAIENFIDFMGSKKLYEKKQPSEWIAVFQAQLQVLNWPGFYALNSEEYQTHERWLILLKEYQQMDLVFDKIGYKKALFLLKQMAGQVVFQPQKKQARVHFLGLLEASGLHFDGLWIMGMNDDQFPGATRLNPFIPHTLQRKNQMPHATPAVEMAFSERLMQHFLCGGDEVVFSYLSQKGDSPAFESPLIRAIEVTTELCRGEPPCSPADQQSIGQARGPAPTNIVDNISTIFLETIQDNANLPCTPDEIIKGGTTLIKNQALCPFRAFAKHRLGAKDFEPLDMGLNDRVRGNLVHDALEKFWTIVQTQKKLLAYTYEDLNQLVHETAVKTVQQFAWKKPDVLSAFFLDLEEQRLEQLLIRWLDYEKTRPDFIIDTLEKSKTVTLYSSEQSILDLTLHVRADRVDALASGDKIVIDYKTGTLPSLSSDTDDRPENPQLLLYALSDPAINALAFAQVKPDSPVFKGKSAEEVGISGIKTVDWENERHHWHESMTRLADEFMQGKQSVDPKHETTCDSCDLQSICRITPNSERDLTLQNHFFILKS